jgi:ATP-dependent Zn protease
MQAMTDGFSEGQRVDVEAGGKRVEGVFVRPGDPDDAITVESPAVVGPYKRDVAWVRLSDTEAIEPFRYRLVSAA